jgi:flagellar motor switch protein FliN/FliY
MSDPMDPNANDGAVDDWAAALAEQKAAGDGSVVDGAQPADIFTRFSNTPTTDGNQDLDLIVDIPVTLTVELGRTKIPIKHILQLAQGSVIELDAMAGEPMDVLVNGCLIAQGEVVVVNEKFGIRLTDIVTPSERMRRLHK